jgi:hypothetical protein
MEGQGRRSARLRRSRSRWDERLALKIVVELGFLGGINGAFDRATVPEFKLYFTRRIRNSPMDRPLVVPQIKLRPKHDESWRQALNVVTQEVLLIKVPLQALVVLEVLIVLSCLLTHVALVVVSWQVRI